MMIEYSIIFKLIHIKSHIFYIITSEKSYIQTNSTGDLWAECNP